MRRTTWLVAMGAALAVVAGQAIAQASHENSQQQRMTTCNADAKAKGLKGADRKTFMKSCLSDRTAAAMPSTAAPAAATPGGTTTGNSQQEKMKTCNEDAKTKGLKGTDRKAFMKECLSGSAAH
jgi:hypothetical protein